MRDGKDERQNDCSDCDFKNLEYENATRNWSTHDPAEEIGVKYCYPEIDMR